MSNGAVSAWLDADIGTANEPSALVRIHPTVLQWVLCDIKATHIQISIVTETKLALQRVPAGFGKVNFGEGETARAALQAQGARTAP